MTSNLTGGANLLNSDQPFDIHGDFSTNEGDKGNLGAFYSYTKAICNEDNYCQDYIITCENGELVNQNPITGAAVQQSSDWEDPRKDEALC